MKKETVKVRKAYSRPVIEQLISKAQSTINEQEQDIDAQLLV